MFMAPILCAIHSYIKGFHTGILFSHINFYYTNVFPILSVAKLCEYETAYSLKLYLLVVLSIASSILGFCHGCMHNYK